MLTLCLQCTTKVYTGNGLNTVIKDRYSPTLQNKTWFVHATPPLSKASSTYLYTDARKMHPFYTLEVHLQ